MSELQLLSGLPDKRQVAASFSRAADSYDAVADLQRSVGQQLLQCLPDDFTAQRWLDLGSGTGYFSRHLATRFPAAEGLALDIAEGMLHHARPLGGAEHWLAGDAERLPLRPACCDLLYSSLALQWCADLPAVLAEAARVLRPGGLFAFSSLCAGTLQELRSSWQAADGFVHVNRFREFSAYQAVTAASTLQIVQLEQRAEVVHFPDVRELTRSLKELGAHNLNPGRPDGLTGRQRIRRLIDAYEQFRQPAGLPATYQVVFALLRKEP
jgi:malonyl-CoA O-methyltransferase